MKSDRRSPIAAVLGQFQNTDAEMALPVHTTVVADSVLGTWMERRMQKPQMLGVLVVCPAAACVSSPPTGAVELSHGGGQLHLLPVHTTPLPLFGAIVSAAAEP